MKRKQMLLEHSLGRSVGCCDVWRVILAQTVKNLPASTRNLGLISGSGRCPGEGNGNPLQYSCLENSMGRGVWQPMVQGVTKS